MKAQDDTQVVKVSILITDEDGAVVEQGEAVQADGLRCEYTTTTVASNPAAANISATAHDLPGNSYTLVWQNN